MSFQQKMETIQYNVALAITCAIRGSSREKLYQELGLEALQQHRWFKKTLLLLQNTKITVSKVPLFSYQKQPTEVFFVKRCSQKFHKIHRKTPVPESFFKKNRLWHRCFLVNFVKFRITPFLQNTFGRLLLNYFFTQAVIVIKFQK